MRESRTYGLGGGRAMKRTSLPLQRRSSATRLPLGRSRRGWPRDLVKVGFNTLVNADTPLSAQPAIANEIGGEGAYAKAEALVRDIKAKHPAIAHMFASGAGLALMRRDSEMTEALLLRLTARGVVALPIHDSYVVAEKSKGDLLEGMAAALHNSVGNNVAI